MLLVPSQSEGLHHYLQSGQRLQVMEPLGVDDGDLVDVQVQLGGLGGDALGDLRELGVAAPIN